MTVNEFFTNLASGATWAAGVAFQRSNPLPLDKYSVFQSEADLVTYVTTNAVAYPGQIVAVYDEETASMKAYVISSVGADGNYIAVGSETVIDGKSIVEKTDGALEVAGFGEAESLTLPQKQADGTIKWVSIDTIAQGDGNTKYTFTEKIADSNVSFEVKSSDEENAQTIHLDAYSKSEIDSKFEAIPSYSVAEGEKVLKLNDTAFSTEIGLKHENGKISLTGIGGEVIAEFSDADFVKDSVLEDVEYNAETQKIVFTWKTVDGETKTDEVSVADFVQTYTAGAGLELSGNEFAVKVDSESEAFLSVGANGVKLAGVQTAIDAAKQAAIDDAAGKYATTGNLNDLAGRVETLEDIDHTLYATKEELTPIATTANNAAQKVETLEDKIDEITSVGGEPNIIEYIQVNGVAQTVIDKTVNIAVPANLSDLNGWTELDGRVTTAQNTANDASAAAEAAQSTANTNAGEITKHENRIAGLEAAKNTQAGEIAALQQADATHAGEYTTLKDLVNGHAAAIAGKADQTALDAVSAKATTNETAIKTLNETTIPGINTEIGKKANAADVYTKTEVGTIAEGKTLVEMINEAKNEASYDDTEVRGLITAEADRATAAEQAMDGRLVKVETFFKTAEGETLNEALDTLVEIQKFITDEGTAADGMLTQIQANTTAIAAINNETTGILAQAKAHAQNLFDSIPTATEGVLGLIKYDNVTIKKNDSNQLYVGQVSTDALVNGQDEFILNGGSAV